MMRPVIAKTTSALRSGSLCCAEEKNPGHLGPGQFTRQFSAVLFRGQTAVVSDAFCRFQNANEAPPPDAKSVT